MKARIPPRRPAAALVCGAALLRSIGATAAPPSYLPVADMSSLGFSGTQQGEKFTGVFRAFDARVAYAPEQLAGSAITATIRISSLDTKNQERDSALAGADWFDVAKFPVATFRTTAIRMTPSGPVGDAELTIKSSTRKIAFPFAWKVDGGHFVLDARVTLDRLDFGVGTGEWADESIAGHKVEVTVHLVLALGAPAGAAGNAAGAATPAAKH